MKDNNYAKIGDFGCVMLLENEDEKEKTEDTESKANTDTKSTLNNTQDVPQGMFKQFSDNPFEVADQDDFLDKLDDNLLVG